VRGAWNPIQFSGWDFLCLHILLREDPLPTIGRLFFFKEALTVMVGAIFG